MSIKTSAPLVTNVRRIEDYEPRDWDLLEEIMSLEARESFWAFRKYINPDMLIGWWQRRVAFELQAFYEDVCAHQRPILLLQSPPQHGKSKQLVDFVAWLAGKNPNWKTIYASFSDDLGSTANMLLQRIMTSERYDKVFPHVKIGLPGLICNSSHIEYGGHDGSFINTTVQGQVTGKGLHIGVVDDPIKGRAEAESETNRKKVWDWFTDDFFTRMAEDSGTVMIMTRWHLDDPAGRLLKAAAQDADTSYNIREVKYPAIAIEDEKFRRKGEPLFPELKSLKFLLERKSLMSSIGWESEYQQSPILSGGNMFKQHWFELVGAAPADCRWIRRWDLAGTEDDGDYTAGVLMGFSNFTNKYYISDVKRDRIEGDAVKKLIRQTAQIDAMRLGRKNYSVWIPQDPGQAGKVQAQDFMVLLSGWDAHTELESGDKVTRALPFAAQCEAGNVKLLEGKWNQNYLDELAVFPVGEYDDQVDASSGAFGALLLNPVQRLRVGTIRGAF